MWVSLRRPADLFGLRWTRASFPIENKDAENNGNIPKRDDAPGLSASPPGPLLFEARLNEVVGFHRLTRSHRRRRIGVQPQTYPHFYNTF